MNEMQDSVAKTSLKEKDVKFSRLKKHFSSEIIEQRHLFREKVYHGRHLSLPRWHIFDSAKNVRDKTSGISSRRNGWSFLTASLIECHMELSNGDTYFADALGTNRISTNGERARRELARALLNDNVVSVCCESTALLFLSFPHVCLSFD